MSIIEVENLRRVYRAKMGLFSHKVKEIVALDGISFNVERGELFGLLGPNGAGKTTTIKILTTLLTPTSGRATILGKDVVKYPKALQQRIGFVFGGERGLYWRLSGSDNLRYFANLYHISPADARKRIPALLELVGLKGREEEKVAGYSRGMKQRLHIARALLHEPEILFLDEPTIGLDPVGAREVRTLIRELQSQGKVILLTTHYMLEADELCHRIAVINEGKIIALDTPEALKKYVQDLSVVEVELDVLPSEARSLVEKLPGAKTVVVESHDNLQFLRVHSSLGSEIVAPLVSLLGSQGLPIHRILVRNPTLEDAYVRLVEGKA